MTSYPIARPAQNRMSFFMQSSLFPVAAIALFCLGAPATAQTLNYLDHVNVEFEHSSVLSTNMALYYRDMYGDLQSPQVAPPIDGAGGVHAHFFLYSSREIRYLGYNASGAGGIASTGPSDWFPTISYSPEMSLGIGTEVSYTPGSTPFPPPTNGPNTLFTQSAFMTGARSSLYEFNLAAHTRLNTTTLAAYPGNPPYTPGNALLTVGNYTAFLTSNGGIYRQEYHNPDGSGRLIPFVTAQGSAAGELNNPSALAIGPDGLLYVLDAGNARVQKFDQTTGVYRGGFDLPQGMSVYSQTVMTEADESGFQHAVLDENGKPIYLNSGGDVYSTSLAINAEGHIYLGDGLGGGYVFSSNGDLLSTFHPPEDDGTWVDGGLVTGVSGQVGVGSFLQYDGLGNVFTYLEGKGFFMYRDPTYDELDFVNLRVQGGQDMTTGPGASVASALTLRNDLASNFARLNIVDPLTLRTGNIFVSADDWGRGSTGIIEGGTIVTDKDVTKINSGKLIMNNTNTYTTRTIVQDGTLILNGSIAGDAVVKTGATLGGEGVIGGDTLVEGGGTLNPGDNSTNLLTIEGDLTMEELATLVMEIGGTEAGLYDQLRIDGIFTAGGTLSLDLVDGYVPNAGDSFLLFTNGGFDLGEFTNITTNLGDGLTWDTSQLASTGRVTAVPEPATWALLVLGLLALLLRSQDARRYRSSPGI